MRRREIAVTELRSREPYLGDEGSCVVGFRRQLARVRVNNDLPCRRWDARLRCDGIGVVPAWCFRGVSVSSSLSQIYKGGKAGTSLAPCWLATD